MIKCANAKMIYPCSNKSSRGLGPLAGAGFICNQYSETLMYKATANPTAAAAAVELCRMTHVAMHNPKYVRYLVKVT